MHKFYEIAPLDTFFFRGSEPMESGQIAVTELFPPPVSVIQGALRTAILTQKSCSYKDYNQGKVSNEIVSLIGNSGEKAPFEVNAILLKKGNEIFAPAPYSWYVNDDKNIQENTEIFYAESLDRELIEKLKLFSSSNNIPIVSKCKNPKSLGGGWIKLNYLLKKPRELKKGDYALSKNFYDVENRIGIALDTNRSVIKGQLYSASHIRLKEDVSIVISINKEIGLEKEGIIKLGGEQRQSYYTEIEGIDLRFNQSGNKYVALAPVKVDEKILSKVFCSGKIYYISGWDLAKGFHKSTEAWLPAGSVFIENINNQCISIN